MSFKLSYWLFIQWNCFSFQALWHLFQFEWLMKIVITSIKSQSSTAIMDCSCWACSRNLIPHIELCSSVTNLKHYFLMSWIEKFGEFEYEFIKKHSSIAGLFLNCLADIPSLNLSYSEKLANSIVVVLIIDASAKQFTKKQYFIER